MKRYNYFEAVEKIQALKEIAARKGTDVSKLIREATDKILDGAEETAPSGG
jgi:hypothetical protein